MGEAQYRTSFDARLTYNVTAPGSASAAAQVYGLLTASQKAEVDQYVVMEMQITPIANALNYCHATPGNVAPFVLSPFTGFVNINAGQKPNEFIAVEQADKKVFIVSAVVGTTVVQVAFDCVSRDLV